jgi:GT2 family glycosyltransferase
LCPGGSPHGPPPRLSIVIPSWKNLGFLDLAVRSLREHSARNHEIIVFFNETDTDCRAWGEGKNILYDESPENLGVCGAVNRAVRLASCDYICFFNDDMYALPGWDTALAQYFGLADKLWLSSTAVEAGRAAACYIGGRDYGSGPSDFREQSLLREFRTLKRPYNVVSTWTPTVLPLANWEAVGGFDEAYFPGPGSDPDLAMKMYAYGCRHFIGVGSSLVYHFSRTTTARFDQRRTMDPRAYFRQKWGMRRGTFLRRILCRDRVITPRLMRKLTSR